MTHGFVDLIAPGIAAAAVVAGVWQYRLTSQREFIKPVREAQLKLYQEASSAAAQIATLERDSSGWKQAKAEFLRLYYGPLAIVEDFDRAVGGESQKKLTVENAMIIFKSGLDNEKLCNELRVSLSDLSLALAHSCRESLGRSWGYDLPQLKGDLDYQQIALDFEKKLEATQNGGKVPT